MRIHKRMAWFLLAAVLTAASVPAAAAPNGSETEAVTEESPAADIPAAEDVNGIIEQMMSEMDPEEIIDISRTIFSVYNSEEFRHLMEYPQMQALGETVLKRCILMFIDEPELAREIMVTMGVDETAASMMELLAEKVKKTDAYKSLSSE